MATQGVVASGEQLVWLLWQLACERPLYFLLAVIVPLGVLGVFAVSGILSYCSVFHHP